MTTGIPESDTATREALMAQAVSLGYPSSVVRTFNMRVYDVPDDVAEAFLNPVQPLSEPKRAPRRSRHKEDSHGE